MYMDLSPADLGLDMLKRCVAGRARQVSRVITARYDRELRPLGVTANQLTMLALLATLGPSRPADLEPYLMMGQSTVSRNLARMVENGWVETSAAEDRRTHLVRLTAAGEALLEEARAPWERAQAWAMETIGEGSVGHIDRVSKTFNPRIP